MNWLVGNSNQKARQISNAYIGVNNVAKRIKRAYIGVDGVAKLFFNAEPVLIFEQATPGTYTLSLSPGMYEMTMIGGGASGMAMASSSKGYRFQGGCGGTAQAIVRVSKSCTATLTVGAGGVKVSASAMVAGNNSRIDGITDAVLIAGGGKTDVDATAVVGGSIGDNQISGTAIHSIAINNPTAIRGGGQSYTIKSGGMIPAWRSTKENTNWPEDTSRGRGGAPGQNGENGFIRIIKI